MANKIVTIDVDLGINIESLIQNDVINLTAETQLKLDESIAAAKSEQIAIQKVKDTRNLKTNAISDKLTSIIEALSTAGDSGIEKLKLMQLAEPIISFSGLATRLRTELRNTSSEYRLEIMKNGNYRLQFFGSSDSGETQ